MMGFRMGPLPLRQETRWRCVVHGAIDLERAIVCNPDHDGRPFLRCPVLEGWDQCGLRLAQDDPTELIRLSFRREPLRPWPQWPVLRPLTNSDGSKRQPHGRRYSRREEER